MAISLKLSVLAAIAFVGLPLAASAATIGRPTNNLGMVGYWTFDGSQTNWATGQTADATGNGNTGSLIAMSTTTAPIGGVVGSAFNFTGSNYVSIANESNFDFERTQAFSVCAWIKPTRVDENNTSRPIVSKLQGTSPFTGWEFAQYVPSAGNDGLQLYLINSFSGNTISAYRSGVLTAGVWQHGCVTYTGNSNVSGVTFYKNGVRHAAQSSINNLSASILNNISTSIGMRPGTPNLPFSGGIDDVRVFSRLLSPEEIYQLYQAGRNTIGHAGTGSTIPLGSGLVGYWTFDGSQTNWATGQITDLSGQGNTGSAISLSTTTSSVIGKKGQALQFNGGTQRILVGNTTPLSITGAFTLAAWVKYSAAQVNKGILGKYDTASSNRGYALYTANDGTGAKISCTAQAAGGSFDANAVTTTTGSYNDGKWHYVVCVFSPSARLQIFVDGAVASANAVSIPSSIFNSTANFEIGNYNQASGNFTGAIDDVRVYNRALSGDEVRALSGVGANTIGQTSSSLSGDNLVGHWPFDGSSIDWGTNTFMDVSGHGNNGTSTVMSTTTSPIAGKIGQALRFNGTSNYIGIPNSSSLQVSSSITINAWINVSAHTGTYREIFRKSSGNYGYFFLINTTNKVAFAPSGVIGEYSNGFAYPADAKWHMVTATFDGSLVRLYLDSAFQISYSGGSLTVNSDPASIGTCFCNPQFFKGSIDDVRVYDRALSGQEVQALYNTGR